MDFSLIKQPLIPISAAIFFASCSVENTSATNEETETKDPFTSAVATLLDFEMDGELITSRSWGLSSVIEDQFLYTVGMLNANRSVGRIDKLEISNIDRTSIAGGLYRVTYHAKLPVAWGSKTNLPTSYDLVLPKRVDSAGLNQFTDLYKDTCAKSSSHGVDAGSMWYYYRPNYSACNLADEHVVRLSPTISESELNLTGKYPEYHKVWSDKTLIVVAIFGKNEDGATSNDAGISAFNSFVSRVRSHLGSGYTTIPADLPSSPGVAIPDVTIEKDLGEGRMIRVHALLVDNVRTAGATFDRRYEELSVEADLIAYNGHSGLGANIRALARKGDFRSGKYQIFFLNGCDTFAYVDDALATTRARLNPSDPTGTKYMEIITNAMPSFFSNNARADMALLTGLLKHDAPMTYEAIFHNISSSQVVVVTGEEDNVYRPGGGGEWEGLQEQGTVARSEELRWETPQLEAGVYLFEMTGEGDADLYVRTAAAPTTSDWDCRPYSGSSNETCTVTLTEPDVIHIMVRGYAAESDFVLTGEQQRDPEERWEGMSDEGTVERGQEMRYETPQLSEGQYTFVMSGDGDADLYVRVGGAPNTSAYDCRPYSSSSNETCTVTLSETTTIHVMVRGYAEASTFELAGRQDS